MIEAYCDPCESNVIGKRGVCPWCDTPIQAVSDVDRWSVLRALEATLLTMTTTSEYKEQQ